MLLWLLAGCADSPSRWGPAVGEKIDQSLEQAEQDSRPTTTAEPVPRDVSDALLPPLRMAVPQASVTPPVERFDLVVENAPARQVFMGLVEGTDASMVIHPEVDGLISLNLKDVTLDEAMRTIRKMYGYEYQREGRRYLVLSPNLQTRIFRVNYLNMSRLGRSDTRVSSGELTRAVEGGGGSRNQGGSRRETKSHVPSIHVETKTQADFWTELKQNLASLIGVEEGHRVVVNPQAGLVVVRAYPAELRLVSEYLGATHENLNRQVILEAKILEVELKDGFQSGINWSRLYRKQGSEKDIDWTVGQVGGGTVLDSGISEIATNTGNLDPSAPVPIAGTVASAFGGVFTLAIEATQFNAFVELLKTQGDVHVLSSPRVSTVNNQKAVIKVGGDSFFITGVTSSGTTEQGASTAPEIELTPLFSGIALDVTPQINEDGKIILHIHPTISEVTQRNQSFVVGDENFNLPLAISSIQESDSIVRAQSGQIIVIGGLMKEGSTGEDASVPFIGDVPLLGNLFKHKRVSRIKRELIILMKPTVVGGGAGWGPAIQESHERFRQYRRPRPFAVGQTP
jgi:MSHA biogenesis protein MshL